LFFISAYADGFLLLEAKVKLLKSFGEALVKSEDKQ
jgi:hypothetical protein